MQRRGNELNTPDANQIFLECDRFVKMLKHEKQSLKRLRREANKEGIDYAIRTNPELVRMVSWRLNQLEEAQANLGWWRKKVATSLIKQIQHEFSMTQELLKLVMQENISLLD